VIWWTYCTIQRLLAGGRVERAERSCWTQTGHAGDEGRRGTCDRIVDSPAAEDVIWAELALLAAVLAEVGVAAAVGERIRARKGA